MSTSPDQHTNGSLHGENAMARAREMVETMRKKGDTEGADTWLRVIAAITTGARH
jgi:hypothetical protein